jgi:hypothetical protein
MLGLVVVSGIGYARTMDELNAQPKTEAAD